MDYKFAKAKCLKNEQHQDLLLSFNKEIKMFIPPTQRCLFESKFYALIKI
jgi:hypothetical protein